MVVSQAIQVSLFLLPNGEVQYAVLNRGGSRMMSEEQFNNFVQKLKEGTNGY